jgi:hypothetical protein
MDRYILDENNNPVAEPDLMKWAQWLENSERVLQHDKLPNDVLVSTVFLGINHNWGGGAPLLWETMIFGGAHDQYQDRYSSINEALAGHNNAVKLASGKSN